MRVVQINSLAKTKSTGRTTYEMHRWFISHNIDSLVLTSALGANEDKYGQVIFGNKYDIRIHSFLSRLTGLQGYFSNGVTREIINVLEKYGPDVVILRVLHSNILNVNVLLRYLKGRGVTTIIVLHDLWFVTGHCTYPTYSECDKYKTECKKCDQLKQGNTSWFFDYSTKIQRERKAIYNAWDKLIFVGVSEWVTGIAKKSAMVDKANTVSTIYNWIDQNHFFPSSNFKHNDDFFIISVASKWDNSKGLDDFIKLSEMLEREKLILVGLIEEKDKKRFTKRNVLFIDFTNSCDELRKLYQRANVYVSLSKAETFGKTIAEAICCGIPAIVYDIAACPELVKDGCGYSVAYGDVEEVYSRINDIKKDGNDKYKKACIDKAEKCFNVDRNMMKYIELIQKNRAIDGDLDK